MGNKAIEALLNKIARVRDEAPIKRRSKRSQTLPNIPKTVWPYVRHLSTDGYNIFDD